MKLQFLDQIFDFEREDGQVGRRVVIQNENQLGEDEETTEQVEVQEQVQEGTVDVEEAIQKIREVVLKSLKFII